MPRARASLLSTVLYRRGETAVIQVAAAGACRFCRDRCCAMPPLPPRASRSSLPSASVSTRSSPLSPAIDRPIKGGMCRSDQRRISSRVSCVALSHHITSLDCGTIPARRDTLGEGQQEGGSGRLSGPRHVSLPHAKRLKHTSLIERESSLAVCRVKRKCAQRVYLTHRVYSLLIDFRRMV